MMILTLGVIFLSFGLFIWLPSFAFMNDDFRYGFCANYSEGIDTNDFEECYHTVQNEALTKNTIGSIIIIISSIIMIISLFPKIPKENKGKATPI